MAFTISASAFALSACFLRSACFKSSWFWRMATSSAALICASSASFLISAAWSAPIERMMPWESEKSWTLKVRSSRPRLARSSLEPSNTLALKLSRSRMSSLRSIWPITSRILPSMTSVTCRVISSLSIFK